MPKRVDHDQRKKRIAEATWKVILERGMEGATVRNIAEEAGLSLGSLRHFFTTQDELLDYAMNLVKDNALARINEIAVQELPPKQKVLAMLLELVPCTEETRAEMEVWFAFTVYARHRKDRFDPQHDGMYVGMCRMIDYMDHHRLLNSALNKDIEAEKLYALVDGLALHAMLEPQRLDKERITKVLVQHLESIGRNDSTQP